MGPIAESARPGTPGNCIAGREIVGPTVGKELKQRGILATGVRASAGILVYIALRFPHQLRRRRGRRDDPRPPDHGRAASRFSSTS
jgi:hypothetical protein